MSIAAAIVGASGYVGGEIIRLLAAHPEFKLVAAASASRYSHTGGHFLFAISVSNAICVGPHQWTGGGLFSRERSSSCVSSAAKANVVVPVAGVVRVTVRRSHVAGVVVP